MLKFKNLKLRIVGDQTISLLGFGFSHFTFNYRMGEDYWLVYHEVTGKTTRLDLGYDMDTNKPHHWYIEGIEVDGHYGTWYTIDKIVMGETVYFLLEHEEYGDETAHIIIDHEGNLVLEDVWNGFDDLEDYFSSADIDD